MERLISKSVLSTHKAPSWNNKDKDKINIGLVVTVQQCEWTIIRIFDWDHFVHSSQDLN